MDEDRSHLNILFLEMNFVAVFQSACHALQVVYFRLSAANSLCGLPFSPVRTIQQKNNMPISKDKTA
jgi:hypothetical protein